MNSSSEMVVSSDQRGKHGQQRKVDEGALLEIKKNIQKIKKSPGYRQKGLLRCSRLYVTHRTDNNLQPEK